MIVVSNFFRKFRDRLAEVGSLLKVTATDTVDCIIKSTLNASNCDDISFAKSFNICMTSAEQVHMKDQQEKGGGENKQ
jgi:hypothetical protein